MDNGSGVSRGDRNCNAKLARLRELVPVTNAIAGVDLADNRQMVVVCDHDSSSPSRCRSRHRDRRTAGVPPPGIPTRCCLLDWELGGGVENRLRWDRLVLPVQNEL